MNLPFVYKYQPLNLKDFEMDRKLRELIMTLFTVDSLNILLIGDSGSGKTTLINAIMYEYYNKLDHKNIMHINSLKDQGISYYRNEVKTFCQTASTIPGKKKCLVLDDLDMIHEQSQQTFRNFIDKYSNNVHFIISCTNPQKISDSIQSRMVIIKIKLLCKKQLYNIARNIINSEGISIDEKALDFVLSICNTSVRALLNYLEKFKLLSKPITPKLAVSLCTDISFDNLEQYINLCKQQKRHEAISILNNIYKDGFSVIDILDKLYLFIKITDKIDDAHKYRMVALLCKYTTIFYNIHEDVIELALFTNNLIQTLS